eukprot:CFRG3078T1
MSTKNRNMHEVSEGARVLTEENLRKGAQFVKPVWDLAKKMIDTVGPMIEKSYSWCEEKYPIIEPYNPSEMIPALLGLLMVFYGGEYMLTISAVEAFRLMGYHQVKAALLVLKKNYQQVAKENRKDNLVDADGDGIADVHQLTESELTSRKIRLVLRTIDPAEVQAGGHVLLMSWCAVIATLKIKFAEAVTLGATLGESLEELATPFVAPPLKKLLDDDYEKWIPTIIQLVTKSIGVTIAWSIFRIIGAFFTAVRGAALFVGGFLSYLKNNNFIEFSIHPASLSFNAIAGVLAVTGFYSQISSDFTTGFLMNLVLFPFNIIEAALYYGVNWT